MDYFYTLLVISNIILLIALFRKKISKMAFPYMLNFIMKRVHSHLVDVKQKFFTEAFEQVDTDNKNKKLEILEIGIGTGENFRHFPRNASLTILDKTDMFLPFLEKSLVTANRTDLTISKLVVNHAENMKSIESNSIDAIVHTFILCSVDNHTLVLNEIYRVLKPGGVCIFMEHSIDNENAIRRTLQRTVEPLCGDCSFKDMKKVVNSGKFDKVTFKEFRVPSYLLTFINPVVYGFGQKSK